jgi:hypothetical protein
VIPGENGEPVVEKLPSMPSDMYLNAGGHVVRVALSTGASIRNRNNEYALHIRNKLEGRGAIRYGLCPPAAAAAGIVDPRWLSMDVRNGEPCQVGTYGTDNPCPHMIQERDARRLRNAKAALEREERQKSLQERRLEQEQRHIEVLEKAILDGKQGRDKPKSK